MGGQDWTLAISGARLGELERAELRLAHVLEIAKIGIWELDLRTRTATWSTETYDILGVAHDRPAIPDTVLGAAHPEDRGLITGELQRVMAGQGRYDVRYRVVYADGEIRHIHSLGQVERDPSGAPTRIVGIVQDVTEQHLLRSQLVHAQKLETVGQLAAGLAHDLNNLLMVIGGGCDFLSDELAEGSPGHEDVATIATAVSRAAALTRGLLAFSRRQVLQPRTLAPADAVSELVRLLPRLLGADIRLEVEVGPAPKVHVDPQQLIQVLMNLAVNARDAMPGGGVLSVVLDAALLPDRLRTADGPQNGARFVIEDTGVGMDEATLGRIFEPFFTTKGPHKGTGLGLSTAYGFVAQSGGDLDVQSTPGEGTRVSILLPAATHVAEAAGPALPSLGARPSRSAKVFVVDDDDDVRGVILRGLRRAGFDTLEAGSPQAALDLVDGGADYDVLLVDVMMPGMPGRALVDALFGRRGPHPTLYMSGFAGDPRVDEKGPRPGDAFLPKPFSPAELAARIEALLAGTMDVAG